MNTDPTAINLDVETNVLTITWGDAHVSTFSGGHLRFVCPCAQCRGDYPGQVPEPVWDAVKDVRVANCEMAGNYALRLDFSDGHNTGIFSFDHLRRSEPADENGEASASE